jgi:hypothetical protein
MGHRRRRLLGSTVGRPRFGLPGDHVGVVLRRADEHEELTSRPDFPTIDTF